MHAPSFAPRVRASIAAALLAAVTAWPAHSAAPRFFPDDPLTREPETQNAAGVKPHELILLYEITESLFGKPGDREPAGRARNVNTIDEVPDSSWFTNRATAIPLTAADVGRGPDETDGPAPGAWAVTAAKSDGVTPGFTVRDSKGEVWFLKFDPPGYPAMATGAEVVSTKLLWALGYNVPQNHIAKLDRTTLTIDPKATLEPRGFPKRPIRQSDLDGLLRHADKDADGTYRVIASRRLQGRPLGGFRFWGTRPDDPNDVIPHEHRRELRGYRVAAAWLNHVDAKSINTLDTLVDEGGRSRVHHYLLDFGSTLGSAAISPRNYPEGFEYMVEPGRIGKRAASIGFAVEPWRRLPLHESPGVGRLPEDPLAFDPDAWRPTVPNAAMLRMQPDDAFWMARRVAAITDDQLRAAVDAGRYTNEADAAFLVKTLSGRRTAIARAYMRDINPIVNPALDESGVLTFANAAVDAGVSKPATKYAARWSQLDNTDASGDREIGRTESAMSTAAPSIAALSIKAPAGLPTGANVFVKVELAAVDSANAAWNTPVTIVFHHVAGGWKLVGLSRTAIRNAQ